MAKYIKSLQAQNKTVVSYIDWHAYSQLFMFPFGSHCSPAAPHDKLLQKGGDLATGALKQKYGSIFKVGSVCRKIYQASGGSLDWTYENGVKFSYAVELRDQGRYGFLLPAKYIIPSSEEAFDAMLALNEFIAVNI